MDIDPEIFRDQDLAFLKTHQIELRNALRAIVVGREVEIDGRKVGREYYANIAPALRMVTMEIQRQEAIIEDPELVDSRVSYPNFSRG